MVGFRGLDSEEQASKLEGQEGKCQWRLSASDTDGSQQLLSHGHSHRAQLVNMKNTSEPHLSSLLREQRNLRHRNSLTWQDCICTVDHNYLGHLFALLLGLSIFQLNNVQRSY